MKFATTLVWNPRANVGQQRVSPTHSMGGPGTPATGERIAATVTLAPPGRTARLAWRDPEPMLPAPTHIRLEHVDMQVNPIACLQAAYARLAPEGSVEIRFAPEDAPEAPPPRLPRWRDYWASIAVRVGFRVSGNGNDGFLLTRTPTAPRWRLALASADDREAIAQLFQTVFGYALSPELWRWKYGDGRGNAILAYHGESLVAHYGAMYRDILFDGRRDWALQVGDVMVHPAHRAVMTKQGAFFQMTATWDEVYGPLAFGFPTRRSMQLGERLGIYADAGRVVELQWTPRPARARLMTHLVPLRTDSAAHARRADALWARMAAEFPKGAVGIRDWAWLSHRFLQHPTRRYEVLAVASRWTGAWQGILVWRDDGERLEVLDMIAPTHGLPSLVSHARRIAARRGRRDVYFWLSEAGQARLPETGATVHDTGISIPTDCWTGSPSSAALVGRWWLTGGDSDFR